MPKKSKSGEKIKVEDKYQKLTQHEHILKLPDTYIKSVIPETAYMYVYDRLLERIIKKEITYNPGLYKICDEIAVNMRDHSVNDKTCTEMRVDIDEETGLISMWNNGNGVPIEIHKKEKIYVPEMIFGHLLTSSHYNSKKKIVGGKNGFGAKLANIYSKDFWIETVDKKKQKKYVQHFSNNMYNKDKPKITSYKGKPYTCIKFIPDFERFGMEGLTKDVISLLEKRVYDLAATSNVSKVLLNGNVLPVKSFEDYVKMYYDSSEESEREIYYQTVNDRWKVAIVYDSEAGYTNISFVNGVCTFLGGTHVDHVVSQVVNGVSQHITNKYKDITIKPAYLKDNMTIFIDSVIEDPSFSSQCKEALTSKLTTFGSRCDLPDAFVKKIIKSGIVEETIRFAQLKAAAALKQSDGKKTGSVKGLVKLKDAAWAGTRRSDRCYLFLTEGDSAKSFALSGLEVIGHNQYGVFPLRGKLLNVRDASTKQIGNNTEIQDLKKILGLKQNMKYTDVSKLRYGGIIILTDQDVDGSHIKGLIMNFLHFFWPSLLQIPNFVRWMSTPILKAFKPSDKKKKNPKIYYTLSDYNNDVASGKLKGWEAKYYKGLGTSTPTEAQECFEKLEQHLVALSWENDVNLKIVDKKPSVVDEDADEDGEESVDNEASEEDLMGDMHSSAAKAMNLAFNTKYAGARKEWLAHYDPNDIIENNVSMVTYPEFVHKELKHFSRYDNIRSIASIVDGFKPSHRKIMYGAYLRGLQKKEVKVVQLAGFVSDNAEYHHGEESLQGAIINMAQNFVGSNNIYFLMPNGNFGSRVRGGKDAASPRYIFTQINPLTNLVIRDEDAPVLEYIVDDGKTIEPTFYEPIIPPVLINGTEGIGTGYSTTIPPFNPLTVVKNIKRLLKGEELAVMYPWFHGHKRKVLKLNETSFMTRGTIKAISNDKVRITELPVGKWTQNYLETLEGMVINEKTKKPTAKKFVLKYEDSSGLNYVDITVTLFPGVLQKLIIDDKLHAAFRLESRLSLRNMVLHNAEGQIVRYDTVHELLTEWFYHRREIYVKRKGYHTDLLENEMNILEQQMRFIKMKVSGKISIENRKKEVIIEDLKKKNFPILSRKLYVSDDKKDYGYITNLSLFSLTTEKIDELQKKLDEKQEELDHYRTTTVEQIWGSELDEFIEGYHKYLADREGEWGDAEKRRKKGTKKTGGKKTSGKKTTKSRVKVVKAN